MKRSAPISTANDARIAIKGIRQVLAEKPKFCLAADMLNTAIQVVQQQRRDIVALERRLEKLTPKKKGKTKR